MQRDMIHVAILTTFFKLESVDSVGRVGRSGSSQKTRCVKRAKV